jgi:hypothetical protein
MEQKKRLINLIKASISKDKLNIEEEMEAIINSPSTDIDKKEMGIKKCLKELVLIDLMLPKWDFYTKSPSISIEDVISGNVNPEDFIPEELKEKKD